MITSFANRALRLFWEEGQTRRLPVPPANHKKLRLILEALNAATVPQDMNRPGWRYHPWQGRPRYSVDVSGAWRVLWYWRDGNAADVDLENPH